MWHHHSHTVGTESVVARITLLTPNSRDVWHAVTWSHSGAYSLSLKMQIKCLHKMADPPYKKKKRVDGLNTSKINLFHLTMKMSLSPKFSLHFERGIHGENLTFHTISFCQTLNEWRPTLSKFCIKTIPFDWYIKTG